ncbi:MAG: hypothetical protein P1U58_14265 [Verrucomicrobiales bacterium]|nr:hypothetical protein [Verrucomicrobiales bacterium]
MNQKLKEAAEVWLNGHADSIEFFEKFLPFDLVPEDEENPEEWAQTLGHENDGCVAYLLQPVTSEDGGHGVALIFGKGHAWEGLRLSVEGIYESKENALRSIEKLGVRL